MITVVNHFDRALTYTLNDNTTFTVDAYSSKVLDKESNITHLMLDAEAMGYISIVKADFPKTTKKGE